jgi:hypothetical protein
MAAIPKFDEANLQALAGILGDTSTGLTGSEIGRYLRECGFPGTIPQMAKLHQLYAALYRARWGAKRRRLREQCARFLLCTS